MTVKVEFTTTRKDPDSSARPQPIQKTPGAATTGAQGQERAAAPRGTQAGFYPLRLKNKESDSESQREVKIYVTPERAQGLGTNRAALGTAFSVKLATHR